MKIPVSREEIRIYYSCSKCGALDIGDVWTCPICGETSGFLTTWMGFIRDGKSYITGDPAMNKSFGKTFVLKKEKASL